MGSSQMTMPKQGDVVSGVFQDIFSVYLAVLVFFWLISYLRPEQPPKRKKKSRNKKEREAEIEKEKDSVEKKDEDNKNEEEAEGDKPSDGIQNDGETSSEQKEKGIKTEDQLCAKANEEKQIILEDKKNI